MQSYMIPQLDSQPAIKITRWDLDSLQHLLGSRAATWSWKAVDFLRGELVRAQIVDETYVPGDTVAMRSHVTYRVDDGEIEQVATLGFPGDQELYDDALSVLTPVGASLIGLSEGQTITYPAPDGRRTKIEVLNVAAGANRGGSNRTTAKVKQILPDL